MVSRICRCSISKQLEESAESEREWRVMQAERRVHIHSLEAKQRD
jgi:hypothetical protein